MSEPRIGPQEVLGTGGRPNLRVTEDYGDERPPPTYWFELHMALELPDEQTAKDLRQALQNNLDKAKQLIKEKSKLEIPANEKPKFKRLVDALYQTKQKQIKQKKIKQK